MFGTQVYAEGSIPPKHVDGSRWHVYCSNGALAVLRAPEWRQWLIDHPNDDALIHFANGSAAHIRPGDPLWEAMAEIAKEFTVEVYRLTPCGGYVKWTGSSVSLTDFNAISISAKKAPKLGPPKKTRLVYHSKASKAKASNAP